MALVLGLTSALPAPAVSADRSSDYRDVIGRFDDAMIEKSRDSFPHSDVPLFPIVMTRDALNLALLQTWLLRHEPELASQIRLIATDRS
ncbi:MAG TPA: hypothetical protein PLN52_00330 [Opitutaceae bacterium]|nr:hypothetical protein [Opitutaceae bacterium]